LKHSKKDRGGSRFKSKYGAMASDARLIRFFAMATA
jgi:hypothetical protein